VEVVPTVFVIDADQEVRTAVDLLLRSVRIPAETYASAGDFLEAYDPSRPGCLVMDVRLPGMGGLELQERLAACEIPVPVIIMTAHGDIPMAVQAMRNGAIDFLEKPFRSQVLLDRVYQALEQDALARRRRGQRAMLEARAARLTPREREVMEQVVAGLPNKVVASRLGVTTKAVEACRARTMRKMQASSLAELVRMNIVLAGGVDTLAGLLAAGPRTLTAARVGLGRVLDVPAARQEATPQRASLKSP
jgi:FixJ family two-component response regulator